MKGNKFILAGMATVFATAAVAGGPEPMRAPVAHAQLQHQSAVPLTNHNHFYVGGGLGYGHLAGTPDEVADELSPNDKIKRNAFVAEAYAGYQFMPCLAVELDGLLLPKAKLESQNNVTLAKATQYAVAAALRGSVSVAKQIDLFAKAGVAVDFIKVTTPHGTLKTNKFIEPLVVLGADYKLTPAINVNVEALTTIKNHATNYAGLVGVDYHFA